MGRHLRVILLVIAITLPGYVLSVKDESQTPTGQNQPVPPSNLPPAPPPTPAPQTCSEKSPKYKEASEAFLAAIKAVYTNAIEGIEQNINETLKGKSDVYLEAAEECTNNSSLRESFNHTVFIDFVKFAVQNTTVLKELKTKKQGECILKQTEKFKDCVNTTVFNDSKKPYSGLFNLTQLQFNDLTCGHGVSLKICTVNVLKDNCNDTVEYVSSLFDYMQKYCQKVPKSGSVRLTAFWVGFIVFIFEFTKRALL